VVRLVIRDPELVRVFARDSDRPIEKVVHRLCFLVEWKPRPDTDGVDYDAVSDLVPNAAGVHDVAEASDVRSEPKVAWVARVCALSAASLFRWRSSLDEAATR